MTLKRWKQLFSEETENLTPDEKARGWHFCIDFEGLFVGPTMEEWKHCHCFEGDDKAAREVNHRSSENNEHARA